MVYVSCFLGGIVVILHPHLCQSCAMLSMGQKANKVNGQLSNAALIWTNQLNLH